MTVIDNLTEQWREMIDKTTERALLKREKKSDLIEEILEQHDTIVEKQKRIAELITENDRLTLKYEPYIPPKQRRTKIKLKDHALSISFDPWPLMEWKRLSLSRYNPGRYFQFCVGPLRMDFFQS